MDNSINYISINDIFWIQFRSHLVSFGFKGLPDGVHYTISFNDKDPIINFHVTKNVSDQTNKPKIKIIEIEKTLLDEITPSLMRLLLRKLLQPLDIIALQNRFSYDLGFISYDSLSSLDYQTAIKKGLFDHFKDITKFKKRTRLKIDGDVSRRLEDFTNSEEIQMEIFDRIIDLPIDVTKPIEGGMIISEENIFHVTRIHEKWYEIKTDLKPTELFETLVPPILAKKIASKTKRALIAVKNATSFNDTQHLNKPFRLIRQKKI